MYLDRFVPTGQLEMWSAKNRQGRQYWRPSDPMRQLQTELLGYLRELGVDMPSAHGAVPGGSRVSNARPHRPNRFVYQTDLVAAYASVSAAMMAPVLVEIDERLRVDGVAAVASWLSAHCCADYGRRRGLATGMASVPELFNIYCARQLDGPLAELLAGPGYRDIVYTRYLDDLTFSSQQPIGEKRRRALRQIVVAAGFGINHDRGKSRVVDRQYQAANVCGVVLAPLNAPKPYRLRPSKSARRRAEGRLAVALAGEISPASAHGQVGGCLAAVPSGRNSVDPVVRSMRRAQARLKT